MAYCADLSFLDSRKEEVDVGFELATQKYSPLTFHMAPVDNPAHFAASLFHRQMGSEKSSNSAPAMAMKKGTTTLGFIYQGGIVIAVDSRASMGTFISSQTVTKVIKIYDVILGTMAGGAADCSYWERYLAKLCRLYELRNDEKIPVAAASNLLANIFYSWRGYGLCCGTMIAGWNATEEKPELYFVDDKATRLQGNLFSCGSGSTYAYGVLDTEYRWDLTDKEAVELGQRSIVQAAHRDGASGGVCRVFHCYRGGWKCMVEGADVSELFYKYAAEKGVDGSEL